MFGALPAVVFNQVARIEEWNSEADQLTCCLRYTFSATYTLFPDETDYALAEFTAELNDVNPNNGALIKITNQPLTPFLFVDSNVSNCIRQFYRIRLGP